MAGFLRRKKYNPDPKVNDNTSQQSYAPTSQSGNGASPSTHVPPLFAKFATTHQVTNAPRIVSAPMRLSTTTRRKPEPELDFSSSSRGVAVGNGVTMSVSRVEREPDTRGGLEHTNQATLAAGKSSGSSAVVNFQHSNVYETRIPHPNNQVQSSTHADFPPRPVSRAPMIDKPLPTGPSIPTADPPITSHSPSVLQKSRRSSARVTSVVYQHRPNDQPVTPPVPSRHEKPLPQPATSPPSQLQPISWQAQNMQALPRADPSESRRNVRRDSTPMSPEPSGSHFTAQPPSHPAPYHPVSQPHSLNPQKDLPSQPGPHQPSSFLTPRALPKLPQPTYSQKPPTPSPIVQNLPSPPSPSQSSTRVTLPPRNLHNEQSDFVNQNLNPASTTGPKSGSSNPNVVDHDATPRTIGDGHGSRYTMKHPPLSTGPSLLLPDRSSLHDSVSHSPSSPNIVLQTQKVLFHPHFLFYSRYQKPYHLVSEKHSCG